MLIFALIVALIGAIELYSRRGSAPPPDFWDGP